MVKRLSWAGSVLLAVMVAGTLGYMLVEGWGLRDALFMTIITVATVGFGEVHPLTPAGQIFTMALIIASVGALGFSLGVFIDFIGEGRLRRLWEGRRMTRTIEELAGHHIIVGLGRVGSVVGESLAEDGVPFVIVERDEQAYERARDRGWLAVQGDAAEEPTLVQAGVQRASSLITALAHDGANMFVTVTAKTLNPDLFVVTRSEHEASESALRKAGADRVITPNVIGGRRMANLVVHPFVADYLDLVTHGHEVEFRLQDVELPAGSPLIGKSIREGMVRDRYGTYILAVRHPDGTVDTNPSMDTVMLPGSVLVVLGTPQQIDALSEEV
jgi:voltage-gated potassium channel